MPGTVKDLIAAGQQIHAAQQLQRDSARQVSDAITAARSSEPPSRQHDGQGQAAAR